jgi:hypothetical protein
MELRATSLLDGLPVSGPVPDNERIRIMVAAVGRMIDRDQRFALSMADQFKRRGYLSEKQWVWVDRLTERATRTRTNIGLKSLKAIADIFATARGTLQFPKIVFDDTPLGHSIKLEVCGPKARVPGAINVTGIFGRWKTGVWFGRILTDGTFEQSRDCTKAVADFLTLFAQDPAKFAAEYGIKSGKCCFCRLPLTDPRSTSTGYGPVCAKNYGLPWG